MRKNSNEFESLEYIYTTRQIQRIFRHSFELSRGSQDLQLALFKYMSVMYPKRRFPTGEENPRLFEDLVSNVSLAMNARVARGAHVEKTDQQIRDEVDKVYDLALRANLDRFRVKLHRNERDRLASQAAEQGLRAIVQTDYKNMRKKSKSGLLLHLYNFEGELMQLKLVDEVDSFLTKIGKLYKMALDGSLEIGGLQEVVSYYLNYQTPSSGRRRR